MKPKKPDEQQHKVTLTLDLYLSSELPLEELENGLENGLLDIKLRVVRRGTNKVVARPRQVHKGG